jgi:hypothetical protein
MSAVDPQARLGGQVGWSSTEDMLSIDTALLGLLDLD